MHLNSKYISKTNFFKTEIEKLKTSFNVYYSNRLTDPELAIQSAYNLSIFKANLSDFQSGFNFNFRSEVIFKAVTILQSY